MRSPFVTAARSRSALTGSPFDRGAGGGIGLGEDEDQSMLGLSEIPMKMINFWLLMTAATCTALAEERFISTLGTVQREIHADRLAMTLEVTATDKTIEESNKKLERQLEGLYAQVAALKYPTTALSLKLRSAQKATEYRENEKKWVQIGFSSSATLSVNLIGLTNYGRFLTYLGTEDGFRILWTATSSSAEGDARRHAIAEALRAARAKAMLLAEEGEAKLGKLLEATEEEVTTREFSGSTWSGNSRDPNEGTGAYPIGIFVRVRAKFQLNAK